MFKNAKRTIALVFSVCLLSSMVSCGDTAGEADDTAESTTAVTSAETAAIETEAETTTTAETEAEPEETTTTTATTTVTETEIPEETTVEAPEVSEITIDSLKPENAEIFRNFIDEKQLTGHFDTKENAAAPFYFIANKFFYQENNGAYMEAVLMMCTLDEAKEYLSDGIFDTLRSQGVQYVAVREWTEIEYGEYHLDDLKNAAELPYWYFVWEEDWNDYYIDDYVYVVD